MKAKTVIIKHNRIMGILKRANITVKKFSKRCGWEYQTLNKFINFRLGNTHKSYSKLFKALKILDKTVIYEEIFPNDIEDISKALRFETKVTTAKCIPFIPCGIGDLLVEDKVTDSDFNIDFERLLRVIKRELSVNQYEMIKMHYGLDGCASHTYGEMRKKYKLSDTGISVRISTCFRKHLCKKVYGYRDILKEIPEEAEYTMIDD